MSNPATGLFDGNLEAAPFLQALREQRLLIRTCRECGKPHYYPRALCPYCFGETDWKDCSGNATLYSFSALRKTDAPCILAYVRLEEGVTILTNIVDADIDGLRVGMAVKAVFAGDGVPEDGVAFAPQ